MVTRVIRIFIKAFRMILKKFPEPPHPPKNGNPHVSELSQIALGNEISLVMLFTSKTKFAIFALQYAIEESDFFLKIFDNK